MVVFHDAKPTLILETGGLEAKPPADEALWRYIC